MRIDYNPIIIWWSINPSCSIAKQPELSKLVGPNAWQTCHTWTCKRFWQELLLWAKQQWQLLLALLLEEGRSQTTQWSASGEAMTMAATGMTAMAVTMAIELATTEKTTTFKRKESKKQSTSGVEMVTVMVWWKQQQQCQQQCQWQCQAAHHWWL